MQIFSCGDILRSRYALMLPQPPESWVFLLGEPHWRVEWLSPEGRKRQADVLPGRTVEVEVPATWASPVSAWPYWPAFNLSPGLFKPAGALFPFDVSGDCLSLSWKAGPDTVLYWELVLAGKEGGGAAKADNSKRLPANFDWPRFRELFETDALDEAVRNDPWLVDWRVFAEKTAASGFDRRRLVSGQRETVKIPVSVLGGEVGPWYGTSPFAVPLFSEGGILTVSVNSGVDAWISEKGTLRCNRKAYTFAKYE